MCVCVCVCVCVQCVQCVCVTGLCDCCSVLATVLMGVAYRDGWGLYGWWVWRLQIIPDRLNRLEVCAVGFRLPHLYMWVLMHM